MPADRPPQPSPDRLTPFAGQPIVVGIIPGQPPLVSLTAVSLAEATGASHLHFAYVDPARFVVDELPDGSVRHEPINPDDGDGAWKHTQSFIESQIARDLHGSDVPWTFSYLAGRPDRALTHLARALDAAALVVGARRGRHRVAEFVNGSVSTRLAHHQHRPVVIVPLEVVDWKATTPWV